MARTVDFEGCVPRTTLWIVGKVGLLVLALLGLGCAGGIERDDRRHAGLGDEAYGTGGIDSRGDAGGEDSSSSDGGKTPSENSTSGGDESSGGDGEESGGDSSSSSEGGETGLPVDPGDPHCPAGFEKAIDITDETSDDMGNHRGWVGDAWIGRGDRISLEVWSATGDHYGPIIWSSAGLASALGTFASGQGPVTGTVSEDGLWSLWLIPSDTYVLRDRHRRRSPGRRHPPLHVARPPPHRQR